MNDQPAISVLMPVYNAGPFLRQAVDSILNQTFTGFELIVINDGSTDGSLAVLRAAAARDKRVRLVSRENRGLVATLNEMIALARGPLLARMDADDIAKPRRLELQKAFMDAHPHVVLMGGGFEMIDGKGRVLDFVVPETDDAPIQAQAMRGITPICHPTAIMRRDAVLKVGGYLESMVTAEDLDLWLKLGEVGPLANTAEMLVGYRQHAGSISEKQQQRQMDTKKAAVEAAWKRRGVTGTFDPGKPWRPTGGADSRFEFTVRYGWMAWRNRLWRTSLVYGLKALRLRPLDARTWTLLRQIGVDWTKSLVGRGRA